MLPLLFGRVCQVQSLLKGPSMRWSIVGLNMMVKLDLTATQFGSYPKVLIVGLDRPMARRYQASRRNRRANVYLANWSPSGWRRELKALLRAGGVRPLVEEKRV